jgi:hypothetical protein
LNGFVQSSVKALLDFVRALLEEGVTGAFEGVQNIHQKPGLHPGLEKTARPQFRPRSQGFPGEEFPEPAGASFSEITRHQCGPDRLLVNSLECHTGTAKYGSIPALRHRPRCGVWREILGGALASEGRGEAMSMSSNVMQAIAPGPDGRVADPANNHQDP